MATVGEVVQGSATGAAQAKTAPPAIPALPAQPGAPTGGQQKIVIRDGEPVVAGGQGPGTTSAGRGTPDINIDPAAIVREAIPIFGIMLSMVFVIFVGWPIARAIARRIDKRTETDGLRASDVAPQLRQLQESVDAMAVELERISEAQRYQARLMTEKQPALQVREGPRA